MRYIYFLRDPISNETRYVGQTDNPKRRLRDHIQSSLNENSNTYNTHKSNWIRKLNNDVLNPIMEIVEICESLEESNIKENYWIVKLTAEGKNLTNSHSGDVTEFSTETKQKMSNVRKNKKLEEIVGEEKSKILKKIASDKFKTNNPNKCSNPLVREKISETLKEFFKDKSNHWAYGRKMTTEHNEKLRLSKLNNPKNVGNKKPRTDEQKRKIREKINGSKVKRSEILQFDMKGLMIREWKSMRDIERQTGLLRPQISKCCKGLKTSYAGFIWKYKNESKYI